MAEPRMSHRTRSKAAPDWSAEESLILVNEIHAIESEWGTTLPSYQKWKQIVDNCNSLDVNRNLNQCRRRWNEIFSEYKRVKNAPGGYGSLQADLFDAIDRCVSAKGKRGGDDEVEDEPAEEIEAAKLEDEEEDQAVMDTDPDSDPEAQGRVTKFFFEAGSKKQKRRMKRQKRRIEKLNPWGYFTSPKIKLEDSSNTNGKLENTNCMSLLEESTVETKEQNMCRILQENALQINALLECDTAADVDYNLADLKNAEAVEKTDSTRQRGDKLIIYLENISRTLKDLSDLVEQCK
ncbi:hypothetical protein F511_03742 [Dorcoceras hygrometricum]|uniref:Myb-like domain-containing protein n=1 Tax=Dorcoceras hygrometricum TaxID=472368 RepID=A0A2Z7B788_9LAMI|nr:hypothetical protein F511_03742 [Dorcoceras hygrometricum]